MDRLDEPASLRAALAGALPVYEIPDDDLVGQVLVPAMSASADVRIGAGFFSSQCLAQIAAGLAHFLERSGGTLRLLASCELSEDDVQAIDRGVTDPQQAIDTFAIELLKEPPSRLSRHAADCLAYLVAAGRLDIRFVLMPSGSYHKKLWIFGDGLDEAAVHGSGNATARGLLHNGEQMTLDRTWADGGTAEQRVRLLREQYDRQWHNRHSMSLAVEPAQMLRYLRDRLTAIQPPTTVDFWQAWHEDHRAGREPPLPPGLAQRNIPRRLRIPSSLNWRNAPYAHQGRAIEYLEARGGSGILAIATGGGKTKTSLIAATRVQDRSTGSMLLVILVPSRPLAMQWAKDVGQFGLDAAQLAGVAASARDRALLDVSASLQAGSRTEVLIATLQLFTGDERLRTFVEGESRRHASMLIADEVHNLGAPQFIESPPHYFATRVGLSATPIRQYDAEGTEGLLEYFGAGTPARPDVFEFSLDEAIAAGCLVPYRYFPHRVSLTEAEMERYSDLTEQLVRAGFRADDDGMFLGNERVRRLLRDRRAVVEQASGKLQALRTQLLGVGVAHIHRTLVYVSAKAVAAPGTPRQIEQVTAMLTELGVISHQLTGAETASVMAEDLLHRFGAGEYSVLTAMKVLDEGVDVPQTDTAHLLASSSVRREWVQRRGRILRRAEGKTLATLHDYVVTPPEGAESPSRSLLKSEMSRVEEFGRSSLNEYDAGGAAEFIREIEEAWGR